MAHVKIETYKLSPMTNAQDTPQLVRHFRQSLLWPLQLRPLEKELARNSHWEVLTQDNREVVWSRVEDEFTTADGEFQERHYKEFVAFLPYVQRFVYGEHRRLLRQAGETPPGDSALKVFRRHDVAELRVTLREGEQPVVLSVAHVDLYFFDDMDATLLNVEVYGDNLPLGQVRDLMYRFGRAYPTGWEENGQGVHNAFCAEWLAANGSVLATSDSGDRAKFLSFTNHHRAACVSSHWAYLLRPLALDPSDQPGALRYRQVEYHRMPLMAYLAVDDPRSIPREDWVRLGLIATLHPEETLPPHDPDVIEFERRYCFDRYWTDSEQGPNTRFLCSGRAFVVVGDASEHYFLDQERGILAQFSHQYFMLFLIAHFHRLSLLVFADNLVDAMHDLNIREPNSVRRFKRQIRANFATFLRFTHRYWFRELSERPHVQALYRLCADHLNNDKLYAEIKEEIQDMSDYLDSDAQRRQSNTIVRLTVVTTFSLVGTVATGFLGMNIIAEAEAPMATRWMYFVLTVVGTLALTALLIIKSKRLSDWLDVLSDERLTGRAKLRGLGNIWRGKEIEP